MGLILALLFLAGLLFLYSKRNRNKRYPPGPVGLPIIGNLHQMSPEVHKTFIRLRKTYGDVFSLQLGSFPTIVISDHKLVKKAFHMMSFSGRPKLQRIRDSDHGIIFNQGPAWLEQRRFVLKSLRDFGLGKKRMEGIIHEELEALVEEFKVSVGKPILMQSRFNAPVLNSLWALVTGERYAHDDPRLMDLIKRLSMDVTMSQSADPFSFLPFLGRMRKQFPRIFGEYAKNRSANAKVSNAFMREAIEKHQRNFQGGDFQDLIEAYLAEIESTTDASSSFYKETGLKNLEQVLGDLFAAGAETTSTTLTWAFLLLALHSEIQDTLFAEIKSVIGLGRLPSLEDRPKMPYTEAVIMEVMRYSAMVPVGVFHGTTEETILDDWVIPKDTLVFANLYCIMKDPAVWGDPEVFRPRRFLSLDGNVLEKQEAFLPFSTGKRVCLGESLARDELFLFLTGLFQHFRVSPNPDGPPLSLEYYTAAILAPKPHHLVMHCR